MIVLRARGLGKYFGPTVETDGAARPREAFRALLRIAGLSVNTAAADDVQRTVAAAGHVLRDLSFEIEEGSVVCLAGPAGAGKSVLLSILAGVMFPTAGSVELYAPVTPLLSPGGNLNARATARENIEEARRRAGVADGDAARFAAEVLDFAELHGFEDAPIRTYSTGMVLRLSVALALCGRPSLVLIDDVLAVGDIGFQQKCIDRVHALKEAGCTLVLAFADEALVRQLATRIITLGGGRIVSDQPPHHWSARASGSAAGTAGAVWHVSQSLPENEVIALTRVALAPAADAAGSLEVTMVFEARADGVRCRPVMTVARNGTALFRSVYPDFVNMVSGTTHSFLMALPTAMLPDADYIVAVSAAVLQGQTVFALKSNDTVTLQVRRSQSPAAEAAPLMAFEFPWEVERVVSDAIHA